MKQKQILLTLLVWSAIAPALWAQISHVDMRVEGMT